MGHDKKKFNKNKSKKDGSTRKSNDNSNYNKNNSFKKNITNTISLELILHCLSRNNGITTINNIAKEINLDETQKFLIAEKLDSLEQKGLIDYISKQEIKTNDEMVAEIGINKFIILKLINHTNDNIYKACYLNLKQDSIKENKFFIPSLNTKLSSKKILAYVEYSNETLIATPLYYLDEYTPVVTKSNNDMIIKGIVIKDNEDVYITAINFKTKANILVKNVPLTIKEGDLISTKLLSSPQQHNLESEFIEVLMPRDTPKLSSLLSVYQYDIPFKFSKEILEEAEQATACNLDNRKDIRDITLVTIDDEDAKDFDDAIYAEVHNKQEGSYKLYVAIADVAHYVKPSSNLDIEAQKRGNSVYLPAFVIPMLPDVLSNGWCSLKPQEERGCLLAEIIINRNGLIEDFSFSRALMKSAARLTYKEVNEAIEGNVSSKLEPLMSKVILPINEAYKLLKKARTNRGTLNISTKETKIILDDNDNVLDIKFREALTSHQVVEEFMIAANVSAAKFVAKYKKQEKGLCIYRIHEQPSFEKINNFIESLKSFKIFIKYPKVVNGSFFNELLENNKDEYFFNSLNEVILRSQSQAKYDNLNIGHFGLALKEYAHFTSPIRRYSDLMLHRLILNILDESNSFNYTKNEVQDICSHICKTERIAFNVENAAKDRILAKWFASKIGEEFEVQVSSITQAGMFINVLSNGATGLIPMRTISKTYAIVDTISGFIKDKQNGNIYRLGDIIKAIITESNVVNGLLTFNLPPESHNSNNNFNKKSFDKNKKDKTYSRKR